MIINYLKKIIPRSIKSIGIEIKEKESIKNYREALKTKQKYDKLKIAFIVQFPETWNSLKTVYENSKKMGIESLILCVPKTKSNMDLEYDMKSNNEAFEWFREKNTDAVNAYLENGKWFNLEEYNPSYVFYTRPYNQQYPLPYKVTTVCKYAKTCYITYGYILSRGKVFDISYNYKFILSTNIVFLESKYALNYIKNKYAFQNLLGYNKFVYLGFPRFDLLEQNSIKEKDKITVVWMPRWEFNKKIKGQKFSHFLDYYKDFMNFVNKNKDINFIFRPHPLMFETIINEKILEPDELEKIQQNMKLTKNLIIDEEKDYMPTILKSDILIADASSLLLEFFITKKPIIYCDNAKNYCKTGKLMDSTLYHANKWEDIENTLNKLISGKDDKYEERCNVINTIIGEKNSGAKIIEYIINDYRRNK